MSKRWWFLGCFLVLLTACGQRSPKVELNLLPKPTHVILEVKALGDINPNREGRPSPLVLRLYELRSVADFGNADFVLLYDNDKSVLGPDLVRKEEIILQPNEKKTIHFEALPDTRAIGLFAVFRRYERARWRVAVPVRPGETTVVPVVIRRNDLQVQ